MFNFVNNETTRELSISSKQTTPYPQKTVELHNYLQVCGQQRQQQSEKSDLCHWMIIKN